MSEDIQPAPFFQFRQQIYDKNGRLKHDDTYRNTVVTAGKNYICNNVFVAGTFTQGWFGGLKGTGNIAAGDTMASHAGWAETTAYSGTTRPTVTFSAGVGGTSTAAALSYSMNGTYTAAGLFITTNNVAGGTTGTLYSAGDIATPRTGGSGDTVNITPTLIIS